MEEVYESLDKLLSGYGAEQTSKLNQVKTLLTVIGEDTCEVFCTFTDWDNNGDNAKIQPVLAKFAKYYQPQKHTLLSSIYVFNQRVQEAVELYNQCQTTL